MKMILIWLFLILGTFLLVTTAILSKNQPLLEEGSKNIVTFVYGGEPIVNESIEKPKGFIGIGGTSIEWKFDIEQEDNDIYTEVEVINETTLEITINPKYDLSSVYKWGMAICNISGINSLQYMEEDALWPDYHTLRFSRRARARRDAEIAGAYHRE